MRRRFWGWGYEEQGPDAAQLEAVQRGLQMLLGMAPTAPVPPPALAAIDLPPPRVVAPPGLAERVALRQDRYERALHCYGRSYRDIVRGLRGDFRSAPDLVAYPEDETQIAEVLERCAGARLAVIPFGGGSSVCGGVEGEVGSGYAGVLALDLTRLSRVLEVDPVGCAARIQGGALGPALEAQLRPHGLTLRHYPQSFAHSTLGGWIATRSGGHFATLHTHIDELVASLRLVTPRGVLETRRLPASGAGPQPERWFLGSEGILGVITEAWVRLQRRPRYRASASFGFSDFLRGARFVQEIAQAGLYPANCRLLDPLEAMMAGVTTGQAVAIVGFESADHPLGPWLERALVCARDHGACVLAQGTREEGQGRGGPEERWRTAFLRAPYLRDALVQRGLLVETFETAVTWDRFAALYERVVTATVTTLRQVCGGGLVGCRLTHVYPDGAAPYFTVLAPGEPGEELRQWHAVKEAATAAILAAGGTTTHHHGIGRDFRRYYEQERDPLFAQALRAVKRELDPAWVLNPGVLLAPEPPGAAAGPLRGEHNLSLRPGSLPSASSASAAAGSENISSRHTAGSTPG